jgi:hypothetical protein
MINNLLAHAVVSRLSSLVSSLLFSLLSPAVLRDRRQSPKRPITTLHEDLNRRFLGPRIGGRRRPARATRRATPTAASRVARVVRGRRTRRASSVIEARSVVFPSQRARASHRLASIERRSRAFHSIDAGGTGARVDGDDARDDDER